MTKPLNPPKHVINPPNSGIPPTFYGPRIFSVVNPQTGREVARYDTLEAAQAGVAAADARAAQEF